MSYFDMILILAVSYLWNVVVHSAHMLCVCALTFMMFLWEISSLDPSCHE